MSSPMSGPTPGSASSLPVAVGIAAVVYEDQAAWSLATNTGLVHAALVTGDIPRTVGNALVIAIEAVLSHPDFSSRRVDLFVESDAHRPDFAALAPMMGPITVQSSAGSLGRSALAAASEVIPGYTVEPEQPVASRPEPVLHRITIATDGSAGAAPRGPKGTGSAWVSSSGGSGLCSSTKYKQPIDAELQAIRMALNAHSRQRPLHLVCDSKFAVRIVEDLLAERADTLPSMPSARAHLVSAIQAALRGRDVTISWVKGHQDETSRYRGPRQDKYVALNAAADRLAVVARRGMQMNLAEETIAAQVASILAETRHTSAVPEVS